MRNRGGRGRGRGVPYNIEEHQQQRQQQILPQQPQPPRRPRMNRAAMPYAQLPDHVRHLWPLPQVLPVPRQPSVAPDGTYILSALLNLNCQWVSKTRLREFIYHACFVAQPPILQAGSQISTGVQYVCNRYQLMTKQNSQHSETVRGIVRIMRRDYPVQVIPEFEAHLWRDEHNNAHSMAPFHPDSPRRAQPNIADQEEEEDMEVEAPVDEQAADEPAPDEQVVVQPEADVAGPEQQQQQQAEQHTEGEELEGEEDEGEGVELEREGPAVEDEQVIELNPYIEQFRRNALRMDEIMHESAQVRQMLANRLLANPPSPTINPFTTTRTVDLSVENRAEIARLFCPGTNSSTQQIRHHGRCSVCWSSLGRINMNSAKDLLGMCARDTLKN